jgi:hypothetical protein
VLTYTASSKAIPAVGASVVPGTQTIGEEGNPYHYRRRGTRGDAERDLRPPPP